MNELLQVQNLCAGYKKGSQILDEASLSVEEGTVTSLLGRNGVGKTTTLKCISGQLEPSSGSINFNNTDITHVKPHKAYELGIGLVPEERRIFPDLTVEENLKVPILLGTNTKTEKIYELFPKLGDIRTRKGKYLSGGEKQMLSIARALRAEPDLLLLDEPSEGLAPQIVANVKAIIQNIAEGGTTILLVEQNLDFALELASHHYIMAAGTTAFEGSTEAIYQNPDVADKHLGIHANTSI